MNFMEAVKLMKEDKKVMRGGNLYHCVKGGTIYWSSKGKEERNTSVTLNDIEATDWQIYEEEFKLSDKVCKRQVGELGATYDIAVDDIKTFIQKVKEDVDKLDFTTDTAKERTLLRMEVDKIIDKREGDLK